ncbi:MAG: MlrC C-terminal domain-containing protein, partial [Chloroflexi bacterium]|nr:MlrC C-terminal domain-containing protein [Chloroflexota bacterium]
GMRAYATLVDASAVDACVVAGVGATVHLSVGASIDGRFHQRVELSGTVDHVGTGDVRLSGPAFTGMEVSMGRCAVITQGSISVLLTKRPACTFDPESFRSVGLVPEEADVIAVRSANLFRAGWAGISGEALILDLPGASTPRLDTLRFERAPRRMYPVDRS